MTFRLFKIVFFNVDSTVGFELTVTSAVGFGLAVISSS